jgi:hypothetical protein
MTRRNAYLVVFAVMGAVLIWVVSHRRSEPPQPVQMARGAGNPAAISPSRIGSGLPAEFAILQMHNAFSPGTGQGHKPSGGPEAVLVFKGVVQAGANFTAFIENQGAKQVTQAGVGDPVARGRIKSIDLDAMVYEVGGDSRRIEIGQNLNGEVVVPLAATQPSPPPNVQASAAPPDGAARPNGQPPRSPGKRAGT